MSGSVTSFKTCLGLIGTHSNPRSSWEVPWNEAADWMKSIHVTDLIQFHNLLNLVTIPYTYIIWLVVYLSL